MRRDIALVGAASGWGAGFRETEAGPVALAERGLARWLARSGLDARWAAMVHPALRWSEAPQQTTAAVFDLVACHNAALAEAVASTMACGAFPVVIGGDHAIAMGSWGGVARALARRPFGLIWFDAHLDAHTAATTPSMHPHGMGAAVLLGAGERAFLAVAGGCLKPEHLVYIGARSYEPEELAFLRRLGVRIVFIDELRRRGMTAVLDEAVARAGAAPAGFGVSIDLDGFDPAEAPGIGLKVPDGLRRAEMIAAMRRLHRDPRLLAVEIVEYIPGFDVNERTAHLVRDLLIALLAPAMTLADTSLPELV